MSQRIREANRRNARRSTGPKTTEGRAASSQNALKHGLLLHHQAEFLAMLDSFLAEHAPVTPTESSLVQQMAAALWRLRRISRYEAGHFNYRSRVARRALRQERLRPTDPDVLGFLGFLAFPGSRLLFQQLRLRSLIFEFARFQRRERKQGPGRFRPATPPPPARDSMTPVCRKHHHGGISFAWRERPRW